MGPEARQRRREKREKKLAEYRMVIVGLKAAGKFCSNCQHFGRAPVGLKDRICDLNSDSDGYAIVKPDHVCIRHDRRGDINHET